VVCCRQRLSSVGFAALSRVPDSGTGEHKVGSGSVFVVDANTVLTGTLGEGPAGFERELFFAWFLLGITCSGVLAPQVGAL
jgi:hypothetical protein